MTMICRISLNKGGGGTMGNVRMKTKVVTRSVKTHIIVVYRGRYFPFHVVIFAIVCSYWRHKHCLILCFVIVVVEFLFCYPAPLKGIITITRDN